jgi:hypothetical protein
MEISSSQAGKPLKNYPKVRKTVSSRGKVNTLEARFFSHELNFEGFSVCGMTKFPYLTLLRSGSE